MTGFGGAITAGAISAALYVAALTWPATAPLTALFVSLPGMYLAMLQPPNAVLVWLGAAALLVGVFASPAAAIGLIVPFGLTALAVGRAFRRGLEFPAVAAWGAGAWLAGILAALVLAGDLSLTTEAIREHIAQALGDSVGAGAEDVEVAALAEYADEVASAVTALFPAIVAFAGIAVVVVDLAVLRRFAGVLRASDLRRWRSPDGLVWGLIGAGFASMFAPDAVRPVAMNVLLIVGVVYFLHGLSVVAFYVERVGFPRALRPLLFFFLVMQYVLALGVTIVGLVDLWADLRRLRPRPVDGEAD